MAYRLDLAAKFHALLQGSSAALDSLTIIPSTLVEPSRASLRANLGITETYKFIPPLLRGLQLTNYRGQLLQIETEGKTIKLKAELYELNVYGDSHRDAPIVSRCLTLSTDLDKG